jgi:RimJ/RimL family protein N-acetyltransferase
MTLLTLTQIATNPQLLTATLTTRGGEKLRVRPLEAADAPKLAEFLAGLSEETRRFSTFSSYDIAAAQEMCDAIARYDKLRFVVENSASIVGLLEFSFAIMETDIARYEKYGIMLDAATDCRFGPTLADEYQNKGVGTLVLPFIVDAARKFGKTRIILWGGVFADNARAIRYYEKNGFRWLGKFRFPGYPESLDMMLEW